MLIISSDYLQYHAHAYLYTKPTMVNNLLGSDGENIWLGVQLGSEEVVWLRCSDLTSCRTVDRTGLFRVWFDPSGDPWPDPAKWPSSSSSRSLQQQTQQCVGPPWTRREGFGFASRNASGETNLCVEKDLFDICPNLSKFVGNFPGLILGDVMCVCVCSP